MTANAKPCAEFYSQTRVLRGVARPPLAASQQVLTVRAPEHKPLSQQWYLKPRKASSRLLPGSPAHSWTPRCSPALGRRPVKAQEGPGKQERHGSQKEKPPSRRKTKNLTLKLSVGSAVMISSKIMGQTTFNK